MLGKIYTLILTGGFLLSLQEICAQTNRTTTDSLMTIGEVFDFEVGDQFQYRGTSNGEPPNADRLTITGKYYSDNGATLYYIREHNSYRTTLNWNNGEPFYEYYFYNQTDTVSFTNLSESISVYDNFFLDDTITYKSTRLCDSLINGYYVSVGPDGMPGDNYSKEYGKGLGITYSYFESNDASGSLMYRDELFYYKKGDLICGNPDLVKAQIMQIESTITLFPNPSGSIISFDLNNVFKGNADYKIINLSGLEVLKGKINQELNTVNIELLPAGIYLLEIINQNQSIITRFVKQ